MSTSAMVYIKVKDGHIGKRPKCNLDKLDFEYDVIDKCTKENAEKRIKRVALKKYLGVYVNYDGFPTDLGGELVYKHSNYDELLNMLLVGDMSTMTSCLNSGGRLKPYVGFGYKGTTWDKNKPTCIDEIPDALSTNYCYLYDDGKWYWREGNMQRWRPLTKGLVRKYSWKR